jgi:hypothetical protein
MAYGVTPSSIFVGRATRALRLVGMLRLRATMIVGIVQYCGKSIPRGYDDWYKVDLTIVGRHKLMGLFQTVDMNRSCR